MRRARRCLGGLVAGDDADGGAPGHHRLPDLFVGVVELRLVVFQLPEPRLHPLRRPGLVERGEVGERHAADGRGQGHLAFEPRLGEGGEAHRRAVIAQLVDGDEQHLGAAPHGHPGTAGIPPERRNVPAGVGRGQQLAARGCGDGAVRLVVPAHVAGLRGLLRRRRSRGHRRSGRPGQRRDSRPHAGNPLCARSTRPGDQSQRRIDEPCVQVGCELRFGRAGRRARPARRHQRGEHRKSPQRGFHGPTLTFGQGLSNAGRAIVPARMDHS